MEENPVMMLELYKCCVTIISSLKAIVLSFHLV